MPPDSNIVLQEIPPPTTAKELRDRMDSMYSDKTASSDAVLKAYEFAAKSIRGTPPHLVDGKKKCQATIKQLGPPSFFLTLSADEANWPELYHAIDPVRFKTDEAIDKLTRAKKWDLLNQYSLITVQQFYNCLYALFDFLASSAKPLGGKLEDHFARIEFQECGSLHAHCLLWVSDLQLMDKIIQTEVPRPDQPGYSEVLEFLVK